ncbi:MAG TPA: MCP four helix bundle domain-containing protein, partial [Polyangiaceae bacterium]|nr:MCP four helix bundle domain-containing protein [Polyangiaceae bacterium]
MQWFNNLKLAVKLTSCFILLAILVGLVGNVGRSSTNELGGRVQLMKENVIEAIVNLRDAERQMTLYRGDVWKLLADEGAPHGELIREIEARPAAVERALQKYDSRTKFPGEAELVQEFRSKFAELTAIRNRAVSMEATAHHDAVRLMRDSTPTEKAARAALSKLIELNVEQARVQSSAAVETSHQASRQILLASVIAAALAIGLGLLLSRSLTWAIGEVANAAERIAAGELDVEIALQQKDEIGHLAQTQRRMTAQLRQTVMQIQAVA